MRLFFEPNIGQTNLLNAEESHHAIKVLRLKNADEILVIDGNGSIYTCRIADANQTQCKVEILNKETQHKKPYFLELVIAPTKNMDRIEWLVEKCVEIGIDSFKFIETKNSERTKLRLDRLEKIAISAVKQSKNYFMPSFSELKNLDDVLNENFDGQKFMAHCFEDNKKHLKEVIKPKSRYQILIGPEGDFTPQEIDKALSKNYVPVTFGENRLRTETAAFFGCLAVNLANA
ncbi:MAG: 16S rRNA (uracil(1498)-N(3))-methyltransferase [Bacteroidia bacterium]